MVDIRMTMVETLLYNTMSIGFHSFGVPDLTAIHKHLEVRGIYIGG